jgi:hypothetical protein
MTVCPLLCLIPPRSYDDLVGGEPIDTSCMGEDCGFWSPRVSRCAIGVLGDVADRVGGLK